MRFVVHPDVTFYFLTSTVSKEKKVIVKMLMLIFQEMSILRSQKCLKCLSLFCRCEGPKLVEKLLNQLSSNFPKPVVFAGIDAKKVILKKIKMNSYFS